VKPVLVVLAVLVVLSAAPSQAAIPAAQRSALLALYNATGGSRWENRSGWLGKAGTECSWFGVECNASRTTVTGLSLSDNGLTGSLPASLGSLADLQTLDLSLNQITSPLPSTLTDLIFLESLSLSFNRISGSLPTQLKRLVFLQSLDLSHNEIVGTLPPQLGDLASLRFLDLSQNRLTGTLPAELGRLTDTLAISLGSNQLSGRVPSTLGNLTALMFLDLQDNQLAGSLPAELGNARKLVALLLSANRLGGTIPSSFLNLTSLQTLLLDHNRFTGPVPFELGALTSLNDDGGLDLRFNALATDTEPGLLADLNAKQAGGNWTSSQAPAAPLDPEFTLFGLADRRTDRFVYWTLDVGAGAPPFTVSTASGIGNADLYIRFGAPPTVSEFDAVSAGSINQEEVSVASPRQGTYYIGLHSKSPYRGVNLRFGGLNRCFPSATTLCLGGGRFQVQANWRTPSGSTGTAHGVPVTADTGYFWFFDATNVEVVVKVLDACTVNSRFWVYAGGLTNVEVDLLVTDTAAGTTRTYHNPLGTPFQPIQDSSAFDTCSSGVGGGGFSAIDSSAPAIFPEAGNCAPGSTSLCLAGNRFRVDVTWKLPDGRTGAGQAVPLTADTGYFWFFGASNVEMVIKVLNACSFNNHFWVYAGGLTNVDTTVVVTDTMTSLQKTYHNPQGTPFRPIQESSAFETCP
jgi:pre-peptidase/Leucine Rich Repeat (LRR) protein